MGNKIIITLLLEVMQPHFIPMGEFFATFMKRQIDRGCSCSRKKTRKEVLDEYISLYTGPMFRLDYRLA